MKWQESVGASIFLKPSGYTGAIDYGKEPGSNGLALDATGRLISCEHGDRRISVLTKDGGKMTLADRWDGKRFNSPNDLAVRSNGDIFFTDPIYGLPGHAEDPRREIDFCGVYRLQPDGTVTAQSKDISRPNGIGFSPDQKTVYVANSDGKDPVWRSFPVQDDGSLGMPSVFFDSSKGTTRHLTALRTRRDSTRHRAVRRASVRSRRLSEVLDLMPHSDRRLTGRWHPQKFRVLRCNGSNARSCAATTSHRAAISLRTLTS